MFKSCSCCLEAKPLEAFYRRASGSYYAICKECRRAQMRDYGNQNSERRRQRCSDHYRANRDQAIADQKQRGAGGKSAQRAAEWRRNNPERVKELAAAGRLKRMERVQEAGVFTVLPRDWVRLVQRYGGLCAYCRLRPWEHRDHVVPIARGGRHCIGNLLPACAPCNQEKAARLLIEWTPEEAAA